MKRLKLIVTVIVVLLAVIIILQNTASVETRLLFATVTMPRAVLLVTTTAIGFLAGLVVGGMSRLGGGGSDSKS